VDPETYSLYLKGKEYRGSDYSKLENSLDLLNQAVERDPDFAPAQAALARAMIWHFRNFGEENLGPVSQAREHAEKAIALDSTTADGYIALSDYHHWVEENREQALHYLEIASSKEPDNYEVLAALGGLMFMEGNFQASYHFYRRAVQYDPARPSTSLANVLLWLRKWDELIEYTDAVLATQPDNFLIQTRRAEAMGEKYLSVDSFIAHMPAGYDTLVDDRVMFSYMIAVADLNRDNDEVIRICKARLPFDRTCSDSAITYVTLTWAHSQLKDGSEGVYADSAIREFEQFLSGDSVSGLISLVSQVYMSAAYAMRGDELVADSLCRAVLDKAPVDDQASLSTILNFCAITYVMIGKEDEAIDILEELISRPSNVSLFGLMSYPVWDPLRDHPRFLALIEKARIAEGR
jgi:serine/threonine-protein kinase